MNANLSLRTLRQKQVRSRTRYRRLNYGEVSEWSNVPDSKSGVALCVTVGSNPTLSAK